MRNLPQTVSTLYSAVTPGRETAAIILAAGSSTRMCGIDKQLQPIDGIPVIARTLLAFQQSMLIREITVVTKPEQFSAILDLKKRYQLNKIRHIVGGGATRQDSAKKGLETIGDAFRFVAIADGARCLVTPEMINKVCNAAYAFNAASAAHAVTDTVKKATPTGMVRETVDRKDLWLVQTPQVFSTPLYRAAMERASATGINATDDNALIEALGFSVKLVECGAANMKITTRDDLALAEAIVRSRENKQ